MGNNTLQDASSSSGGRKKFVIDIPEDFDPYLDEPPSWLKRCIYKVPKKLREIKPAAYTPRVISIGPFHHGEVTLNGQKSGMKRQKLAHLAKFCRRTGKNRIELETRIKRYDYEQRIRQCYDLEENDKPHDDGFAEMILLDSVFIIELVIQLKEETDPKSISEHFIRGKPWLSNDVIQDLVLLENQIPYFVLEDLYEFALPNGHPQRPCSFDDPKRPCSFFRLACNLLEGLLVSLKIDKKKTPKEMLEGPVPQDCFTRWKCFWMEKCKHRKPGDEDITKIEFKILFELFEVEHHQNSEEVRIKHLLDLLRKFRIYRLPKVMGPNQRNLYGASMLHKAGVNFHFDPGAWPQEVQFEYGVLKMPRIEIQDGTECVIRNLMAFEQCHYPLQPYICSFMSFLDTLINTEDDVDLLVQKGVLVHFLGDNEAVAKLLNGLGHEITEPMSPYFPIMEKLNEHYENRWYHTWATLRKVYFNNLWKGTATIAAITLLVLTFVQTVCTIKQTFD